MNLYKQCIVGVFTLLTTFSYSQTQGTSEFNISLGIATLEDFRTTIQDATTSLIVSAVSGDKITHTDGSSQMGYTARYSYAIKDRWILGAALTYQTIKGKILVNDIESGGSSSKVYSFGIESDYRYVSKPSFQMYSGLGLGYAFGETTFDLGNKLEFKDSKEDSSSINYFTFHLTALGFRVGKELAAFAELGFGYKGIINAGLLYQF